MKNSIKTFNNAKKRIQRIVDISSEISNALNYYYFSCQKDLRHKRTKIAKKKLEVTLKNMKDQIKNVEDSIKELDQSMEKETRKDKIQKNQDKYMERFGPKESQTL